MLEIAVSAWYGIFVTYLSLKYKAARYPIIVGGALRLGLAWIIGLRLVDIQGATSDARTFERVARQWSALDLGNLLAQFDPSNSYVISVVGALLYKIFGPSPVMLNIVNAGVSVYLIVLSFRLSRMLWGVERGKVAAWVVALFPFAILYGSVFRREAFGSMLFMWGLLKTVQWSRLKATTNLIAAFTFFLAAGVFHGGFIAGMVGLALAAVVETARPLFGSERGRPVNMLPGAVSISVLAILFVALVLSGVELNKVGQLGEINVVESVEARVHDRVSDGGSSFPSVLTGVDPFSNPAVIPGRFIYSVFSPFPWDIRAPNHILGIAATVTFAYLAVSIYRSRKTIYHNKEAFSVFIIVVFVLFVFAISLDNIGTSIRHRTKFVYALAALCAVPVFPKFRFRVSK